MKIYKISYIDKTKNKIESVDEALSYRILKREIQKKGFDIKKHREISMKYIERKISRRTLLSFTKELNYLLKSEIVFSNALNIIISSTSNIYLNYILKNINQSIISGNGIYSSFSIYNKIFGKTYLSIIKVGDISGDLPKSLDDIIIYLEKIEKTKKKIRQALTYPAIIITLASIVIFVLILYVLPNFILLFEESGVKLPLPTRILIFLYENFMIFLFLFIFFIFSTILGLKYLMEIKKYREKIEVLLFKIPVFSKYYKKYMTGKILREFSILLNAGVIISEILSIIENNMNNSILKKRIRKLKESIVSGNTLVSSIYVLEILDKRSIALIGIGEKSANLVEILKNISDLFDEEINDAIDFCLVFLEPVVIIIFGLVVAFIVASIYMPLFNMGDLVLG